jgi:hypothetical protein
MAMRRYSAAQWWIDKAKREVLAASSQTVAAPPTTLELTAADVEKRLELESLKRDPFPIRRSKRKRLAPGIKKAATFERDSPEHYVVCSHLLGLTVKAMLLPPLEAF